MKPAKDEVKVMRGILELKIWNGALVDIAVATFFNIVDSLIVDTSVLQYVNKLKTAKPPELYINKFVGVFAYLRYLFNILPVLVIRHSYGDPKINSAMRYGVETGLGEHSNSIPFPQSVVHVFLVPII